MSTTGGATVGYVGRDRGWRVLFTTVLALAMAVSVYSIPAFAVLSGLILEDLGIDRTQLGVLITAVAASNAFCALAAGRVVDRVGGRRVLMVVFAATAGSAALMAVAPSYETLLVVAVLAGAPNGANNPATNRLIADVVPAGRRGAVVGTKQSGVQAGIFAIGLTLPPVALVVGWQLSLLTVSAAALGGLVLAARVVPPDPPRADERTADAGPLPTAVWWLVGYAFLMGAGGSATSAFLPLYAQEDVGLSLPAAGAAAAAVGGIGMLARIGLGWFLEQLPSYGPAFTLIALGSLASTAAILAADEQQVWPLWAGVGLAGCTIATWNTITMLAAVSHSPDAAGRATGWLMLGGMAGFASSPVLFGMSVERSGGYATGWAGVAGTFGAAAVLMTVWWQSGRSATSWGQ